MIRRALAATVAASAAALATAAPAPAFVVGGNPWPYDVVTYTSDTPAYSASIDRAARLVNRQRLGVRLRRDDRYPDVTFVYNGRSCDGAAYVGYSRRRRGSTVYLGRGCSRDLITLDRRARARPRAGARPRDAPLRAHEPQLRPHRNARGLPQPVAVVLARPSLHQR